MRKLFFAFIVLGFSMHAQDTIRFRNGEIKAVKVTEVGISDVKYNRADNVTGPVYVSPKNDIRYIKYTSGDIDSFPLVKTEVKQIVQPQSQPQNPNAYLNPYACDKLTFGKKDKVLCNGYALSESKLRNVLLSLPEGEKKTKIMKVHQEMKGYQKKQYQYGFGGLIVFVAAYSVGFLGFEISGIYGDINPMPLFIGIAVGGIAAITGSIISKEYKQKRMAKKMQIVKMYNEEFNFQK